jgi:PIN domain nuclease of toxin-antitoxin system
VKLLIDTHVFLWAASEPTRLSDVAKDALVDVANDVYVSAVVGWEIAIKQSLAKLTLSSPAELWVPEVVRRTSFAELPVTLAAALRVRALPWHHRDPFDRLLIAQAQDAGLTIITQDNAFEAYGVPLLRA